MAGWGSLTLGEFDAITVLEHDAIELLNAYWDYLHGSPANVFRGDHPTRLSEGGDMWARELQARLREILTRRVFADDIAPVREIALEFIKGVGLFAVSNGARIARGQDPH